MSDTLRQAAQQALEALELAYAGADAITVLGKAINALRAALAEPHQEPVAWMCSDEELCRKGYSRFSSNCEADWNIPVYTQPPSQESRLRYTVLHQPPQEPVAWQWLNTGHFRKKLPSTAELGNWQPLYTAPLQRKPLTDDQIDKITVQQWGKGFIVPAAARAWAREIEREHGIGEKMTEPMLRIWD